VNGTSLVRADALTRFVALAHDQPFLTLEEERAAAHAWTADGDELAGNRLVMAHLRLVIKIARRYRRQWPNMLDLVQEGNVGLMEALYRFDPSREVRFGSYATFWIRALILRFLLENWSLVKVARTRAGRKLFFELQKERDALRARGIEPTNGLIAKRLGVVREEVDRIAHHLDHGVLALDTASANGGSLADVLEDPADSPEADAARRELSELAGAHMRAFEATLEGRELELWHGRLIAVDPVPLSEMGLRWGVSKQRVGQIEARIKKRLQRRLEQALGRDYGVEFS
jgi:RNA polymerase sigma-32 factor